MIGTYIDKIFSYEDAKYAAGRFIKESSLENAKEALSITINYIFNKNLPNPALLHKPSEVHRVFKQRAMPNIRDFYNYLVSEVGSTRLEKVFEYYVSEERKNLQSGRSVDPYGGVIESYYYALIRNRAGWKDAYKAIDGFKLPYGGSFLNIKFPYELRGVEVNADYAFSYVVVKDMSILSDSKIKGYSPLVCVFVYPSGASMFLSYSYIEGDHALRESFIYSNFSLAKARIKGNDVLSHSILGSEDQSGQGIGLHLEGEGNYFMSHSKILKGAELAFERAQITGNYALTNLVVDAPSSFQESKIKGYYVLSNATINGKESFVKALVEGEWALYNTQVKGFKAFKEAKIKGANAGTNLVFEEVYSGYKAYLGKGVNNDGIVYKWRLK